MSLFSAGAFKRKSRASMDKPVSYKDESDSDDGVPLVSSRRLSPFDATRN